MHKRFSSFAVPVLAAAGALDGQARQRPPARPRGFADGTGPGGRTSGLNDVAEVKDDADTWMCDGGLRRSTGMARFTRV